MIQYEIQQKCKSVIVFSHQKSVSCYFQILVQIDRIIISCGIVACHIQSYLKIFAESAEKWKTKISIISNRMRILTSLFNQKMTLRSTGRKKLWSKCLLEPDVHLQNKQEKNTTAKRTKQQSFLQDICNTTLYRRRIITKHKYKSNIEWQDLIPHSSTVGEHTVRKKKFAHLA